VDFVGGELLDGTASSWERLMAAGHLSEFKYTSLLVNHRACVGRRGSSVRVRIDMGATLQSGALVTALRNIIAFTFSFCSYESVLDDVI
jgi:hypothetical protein